MKQIAKLVIVDSQAKYLLLYRSNHPTFGDDPDLPGGTLEDGESPQETTVREVQEETGIVLDYNSLQEVDLGQHKYNRDKHYSLFITKVVERPKIALSWEHVSYEWLDLNSFLARSKSANDLYMHAVYNALKRQSN